VQVGCGAGILGQQGRRGPVMVAVHRPRGGWDVRG
jgi:hypothetical protein